jgi:outer membrane lipoprotein SlyB
VSVDPHGGGRGKDVATVLGAVSGAIAGNAVESHQRKTWRYDVQVRSDDGSTRVLHYTTPPAFTIGDRISLKTAPG